MAGLRAGGADDAEYERFRGAHQFGPNGGVAGGGGLSGWDGGAADEFVHPALLPASGGGGHAPGMRLSSSLPALSAGGMGGLGGGEPLGLLGPGLTLSAITDADGEAESLLRLLQARLGRHKPRVLDCFDDLDDGSGQVRCRELASTLMHVGSRVARPPLGLSLEEVQRLLARFEDPAARGVVDLRQFANAIFTGRMPGSPPIGTNRPTRRKEAAARRKRRGGGDAGEYGSDDEFYSDDSDESEEEAEGADGGTRTKRGGSNFFGSPGKDGKLLEGMDPLEAQVREASTAVHCVPHHLSSSLTFAHLLSPSSRSASARSSSRGTPPCPSSRAPPTGG